MAHRTVVMLVDDLDGTDAVQTVPFSLDGVNYEIDLSDDNAAQLRAAFEPYLTAGRRTGGRRRTAAVAAAEVAASGTKTVKATIASSSKEGSAPRGKRRRKATATD